MRGLIITCLAVLASALCAGCDGPTASGLGESCERTDDCAGSLLCVRRECRPSQLQLEVLGSQCVRVECLDDQDCCEDGRCACEDERCVRQNVCTTDADCFGNDRCMDRRCAECANDDDCGAQGPCVDGTCSDCEEDLDCPPGRLCVDRLCRECGEDDDCEPGTICDDHECIAQQCQDDSDCGALTECDDGECVERACVDDRECVEHLRDARGACATDGRCVIHCETDAECSGAVGWGLRVCHEGVCEDIGCDSDAQCRARYLLAPDVSGRAVCR